MQAAAGDLDAARAELVQSKAVSCATEAVSIFKLPCAPVLACSSNFPCSPSLCLMISADQAPFKLDFVTSEISQCKALSVNWLSANCLLILCSLL